MGISSAVHAAAMPSMARLNCHITSGFSGLPKFRQLVAAQGFAPEHATLRAASATGGCAPAHGSRRHQRPLHQLASASALLVPLTRTTAASPAPGDSSVFVRTM